MSRNGLILESYARSAGTGNQPVPGTVTSRRNTSRHERQAMMKRREEEEAKLKKQKEAQEQIAKILAHKWAEEDKKKSSRRRRDRSDSSDSDSDKQRAAKEARRSASAAEADRGLEGTEVKDERIGGWMSFERKEDKEEAAAAEKAQRGKAAPERREPKEAFVPEPRDSREPRAERAAGKAASSSSSSSSQARRFTEVTGDGDGFASVSVPPVAPARSSVSLAPVAARGLGAVEGRKPEGKTDGGKAHSKKVANVFGFGVEEDDDQESSRRELEMAAKNKKAKLSLHNDVQAVGEGHQPITASAAAARRPMDMCTQLMKMAEWKRSCGGKRLPMPKDLEASVSKAMNHNNY